jgi:Ser/Thr protein kinase RdoA (MazF antagonist)
MNDTTEGTARLIAEIARSYGFSSVEEWLWIKEGESPAVAMLQADGRRYVARVFADDAAITRADYISELANHLGSVGISVEEVIQTQPSGSRPRLPNGGAVVLSRYYPDLPLPVPYDSDDAQSWGQYVARMHVACRRWQPSTPLVSPWLRHDPVAVLNRAMGLAGSLRESGSILQEASGRIVGCWDRAAEPHPVHGDLWPGNLLKGSNGLRAIDFAESGDGPHTIDMATALRWMPWRTDPSAAAVLWNSWMTGYSKIGTIRQTELHSVVAVACLQQLVWMLVEVDTSATEAESAWYVADHCQAVASLLSSTIN